MTDSHGRILGTPRRGQEAANGGTLCDGDGHTVSLTASLGTVTNNANGTWSWSLPAGAYFHSRTVTITADDRHGGIGTVNFELHPRLSIDIKPKTTNNIIDLRAEGSVPVAILARTDFDPLNEVDLSSLRFGATGSENSLLRVGDTQKPACSGGDVNYDGLWDLVCNFRVLGTGFYCGQNTGILTAVLPAFGTSRAEARDHATLVPCRTIQAPTVIHEGPPLSASFSGVAVSPDGATLYLGGNDAIFSLPRDGGTLLQITTGDFGSATGLAVSRDGSTVFASLVYPQFATNPVVVSLPASGGAATIVANLPIGSQPRGLAVSPDGTRFFVGISNSSQTLLSLPISGGPPFNVLPGGGYDFIQGVAVMSSGETLYMGADGYDRILSVPAAGGVATIVPTGVSFVDPVNVGLSPDDSTLYVLDPEIVMDELGNVVASGGWPGAVFMGPSAGGVYLPLAVGGPDFALAGTIAASPDGTVLYFGGYRRSTGTIVVLSVSTEAD